MHGHKSGTRYTLQLTISSLFITLILVLGAVLSWQSYKKTSEIILSSADDLYDQLARELLLDIEGTYRPVGNTLKLLALSPVVQADSLERRLQSLDLLREALESKAEVTGIQVGYPNGDYLILRPVRDGRIGDRFDAPEEAGFIADHVNTDDQGRRQLVRVFYDAQLRELSRIPPFITEYDPRLRSWYKQALGGSELILTAPYMFHFLAQAGMTLAVQAAKTGVVVASDVTLANLSKNIGRYRITSGSEIAMIGHDGTALAYRDTGKLIRRTATDELRMAQLTELGSGVLTFIGEGLKPEPGSVSFEYEDRLWKGTIRKVSKAGIIDIYALLVSPVDELLSEAIAIRWQSISIMLLIILISVPIVWFTAQRISAPIRRLAGMAGDIRHFDFSKSENPHSFIKEVDDLSQAMEMMKTTISRFLNLINSLAGEQDFDSLLRRITQETMIISHADGALSYLLDEEEAYLEPGPLFERDTGRLAADTLPRLAMSAGGSLIEALSKKESSLVSLSNTQPDELTPLLGLMGVESLSLIALPLRNRQEEIVGVLCLLYRGADSDQGIRQQRDQIAFVQALSGFSAVSLESRQLLMMQKKLLDAFIKLIAGAIDAKSPYTGGHCQRVPELTRLLARAACESDEPPFREFDLDEKGWEALHIASWLHDCGKVTTPEYVVDKATKLETIYDRIHEIRMRFEVLKRDAEIRFWERLAAGGERQTLKRILEQEWQQLDDDFRLVAKCNLGGEFMAPEKVERLHKIGDRTWVRTLDDRIGISWEELQRKSRSDAAPLPVVEKLLDNKQEHLIEREAVDHMPSDNPWGFRLEVPRYKYNRGEIYNLEVSRGTLTSEERYKINDHIVQTIIMLEKLPYPRHLRDVPLIAGCHHETMNGVGYPRRLTRHQMPLTARMMALADIFEALTASDRPYKKAKSLSEAVKIMGFMQKDQHIDADLFELFITKGIFLEYGRNFLQPDQIDEVDISQYFD